MVVGARVQKDPVSGFPRLKRIPKRGYGGGIQIGQRILRIWAGRGRRGACGMLPWSLGLCGWSGHCASPCPTVQGQLCSLCRSEWPEKFA